MSTLARAEQVVHALTTAGLRATVDPAAVNPPAVLVVPPNRTWDVACGFTARWQLFAVAPAALGADRSAWAALDQLVDVVASVVDIEAADLMTFTIQGQSLPAYALSFEEIVQ